MQAADPSGQILTTLIHGVEKRLPAPALSPSGEAKETEDFDSSDPIAAAVERAVAHYEIDQRPKGGFFTDVPGIQRQIEWIGEQLKRGKIERAEKAIVKLIDRQSKRGRREHIVMTLTAIAGLARDLSLFELTLRLLAAVDHLGVPDAAALCVRAETLRDLGRYDEALAAFEETKRCFPHDEVAPTAYAETLRDLGRYDEALAAFEETKRRFPHDEVAPTAYAETLRDLGRYDEALAAFEETKRRFPHDELTARSYGHLLAERGRYAEAEALLAASAERRQTHGDWIAAHILAMARLRAGHTKEALAELERGARSCPFRDQRRYFATALPLALLADQRAAEAARQLEAANDPTLPSVEAVSIVLFLIHALAEAGEKRRAQIQLIARIIDFAAARQRQLASALTERYGLAAGPLPSDTRAQQLSEEIATLEFELVRPKLWIFRANIRHAAWR